jgi:hypothetical protein
MQFRTPAKKDSAEAGIKPLRVLVGAAGIEPATICSQSRYATAALRPGGGRKYPTAPINLTRNQSLIE